MSRPPIYSRKLADKVCKSLARCGSLRQVCREQGMPDRTTVMAWVIDDVDGFSARYARAKSLGIDEFVEETLEIADNGTNDWMECFGKKGESIGWQVNGEAIQRSKLRVDTRKWLAEQMEPTKYGSRQRVDVTNSDGSMAPLDDTARATRLAHLMAKAKARMEAGEEPRADDAG